MVRRKGSGRENDRLAEECVNDSLEAKQSGRRFLQTAPAVLAAVQKIAPEHFATAPGYWLYLSRLGPALLSS